MHTHQYTIGTPQRDTFKRIRKDGVTVWLEASYFPVRDATGKVTQVTKIASDVTERQRSWMDMRALFRALDHALAVIEFEPDGTILTANQNFLRTVGYELEDIQGRHHGMFCYEAFYQNHPDF